ncbi:MAG: PAS domain-containing protein, partial [bacterium]
MSVEFEVMKDNQFGRIIKQADTPIVIYEGETGEVISVNDAVLDLTNYERGKLLDCNVVDLHTTIPQNITWDEH